MRDQTAVALQYARNLIQSLSILVIIAFAIGVVGATLLGFAGYVPWLELDVRTGTNEVQNVGFYTQIAASVFLLALCFFIPSNLRVQKLEMSHREFAMGSEDVALAYAKVHAADRQGNFRLASQFDAVRDRIEYMKSHPDLEMLESDILTLAAQMGAQSHDLATIYSVEKVERAKSFLEQRQQEVARMKGHLERAKLAVADLTRWARDIDMEESILSSQIQIIEEDLRDALEPLGIQLEPRGDNIVRLPQVAGE